MAKGQEEDLLLPTQSSFEGRWHSGREIRDQPGRWGRWRLFVALAQHRMVSEPTALGSRELARK